MLGVSFGGGVAQELALHNPHRVRRLVLASTMCGLGGVPGNPLALALLATPLRYYSPRFLRLTPRWMYGPVADADGRVLHQHLRRPPFPAADPVGLPRPARTRSPDGRAFRGCIASAADARAHGRADPIVPPVNARILGARIPDADRRTSCPTPGTCC